MQITNQSGASTPFDLIPNGFCCWALVTHRGMKTGQNLNDDEKYSRYGDLELTINDNQPFARKKVWTLIGDPDSQDNTEGFRQMGMTALTRMVESAGIVDPKVPESYAKLNGMTCDQVLNLLDGRFVAIKVSIKKGTGGYSDKNNVGEFLTPNEASQSYKAYTKLLQGDHGNVGQQNTQQQRQGGFGNAGSRSTAPVASPPVAQPPAAQGFNPNQASSWLNNAQQR